MSNASATLIASTTATGALLATVGHRATWLAATLAVILVIEVAALALTWKGTK